MGKILNQEFFDRETKKVAMDLLGKFLCRQIRGKVVCAKIKDVEVYDGFEDKASHASRGITPRNKTMFGLPGRWYIYLVYGVHNMLNIVTREKSYPAAILIRGVLGVDGPGRVTNFFNIVRGFNGKKAEKKTGLWIEDRGLIIKKKQIKKGPRVGIDYAGNWANKHYRFLLVD